MIANSELSNLINIITSGRKLVLTPLEYNTKYDLSVEEFKKMIFFYWTSIIYTRSKKDNNNLRNTPASNNKLFMPFSVVIIG